MGLFDGILGKSGAVELDEQKAVMIVIVSAVKADGRISDVEVAQIRSICAWSPIFARNSQEQDSYLIQFADNFTDEHGVEGAVQRAAARIPSPLRETAFSFATRISFADGNVGDSEQRFLASLMQWLALDQSTARKIIEVVAIMNRDV